MGFKRKLTERHKQRISEGMRRAWARIPLDKDEVINLNINYDENDKDYFKVYLDDGEEIKR